MTTTTHDETSFDPSLNMARQCLYRFAALSLLDPKGGAWEQLCLLRDDSVLARATELLRELPEAVPEQLGPGERALDAFNPQSVLDRLPQSYEAFNQEYEDTFGLLVTKACPPYETEYIHSKLVFQRSNALADIAGFYKAFGLTTSDELPERPDHLVLEFEFMAAVLGLLRQAADDDSEVRRQRMEVCHDAQVRFFREHLVWWVPAFARMLGREGKGGFYESVSTFLSAFIPLERALLGVSAPSRAPSPSATERPEECEGCGIESP